MKILWIRPFFPHPPHAGPHILSLQVLRRLHRLHDIHFVAHSLPESREQELAGVREFCTRYSAVDPPVRRKPLRPFVAQLARAFLFGTAEIVSPAMTREVLRLLRAERFDAVVSDSVFVSSAIPDGCPYILLAHNVETVVNERHAHVQERLTLRWRHAIYARHVLRLENHALRQAKEIIALSEVDAATIRARFDRRDVRVMTFGADVDYFRPPAEPVAMRRDLAFLGSMDNEANIDGVHWFCREVLPLIRQTRPETSLAVVGRMPDEGIRALAKDPRIEVPGMVPDVRPWFWSSRVSIVPLRVGGGIRIKIYEAMAAGAPVVSTTIGAEGLRISPEQDILIGDSPAEFARQVLRMLNDEDLRLRIGAAGFELVSRNYSWDKSAGDIDDVLHVHQAAGYPVTLP